VARYFKVAGRRFDRGPGLAVIGAVRHWCDGPVEIVGYSGETSNPHMLGYSDPPIRPVGVPGVRYRSYLPGSSIALPATGKIRDRKIFSTDVMISIGRLI